MLIRTFASAVSGIDAVTVTIEVNVSRGIRFFLVGLPSIIPPLTLDEALETTKIHSVAGKIDDHTALITKRPFRSPHHTISDEVVINYEVDYFMSPTSTTLTF